MRARQFSFKKLGDGEPWLETDVRTPTESISTTVVLAPDGQIALLTGSRSSDNLPANMSTIGHASYGINDNVTNPEPTWAQYLEARRSANAGATYNVEMDFVNLGATFNLTPYATIDNSSTQTVNTWLTNGGGDVALGGAEVSACMALKANPQKFNRGIVVLSGALNTTLNEFVAAPMAARYAWYDATGLQSWKDGEGSRQTRKNDTAASGVLDEVYRKRANGTDATGNLDTAWRANYYGYSGSADYLGGFQQIIQRGTFSGGNVRYSYDVEVKNTDGTTSQVSLNGLADKSFAPFPDNLISLGTASFRWTVVYATTGTINTSDERAKTDIKDIDVAALRAWGKVQYCQYRFRDAIERKGDGARWHIGLIAQRVKEAFESEGLDPFAYGLLCYDEWNETVSDSGAVIPDGNRYGIRYEEALALECAYLRSQLRS